MKYQITKAVVDFKDSPKSLDTQAEIDYSRIKMEELRKSYSEYEIAFERLERLNICGEKTDNG